MVKATELEADDRLNSSKKKQEIIINKFDKSMAFNTEVLSYDCWSPSEERIFFASSVFAMKDQIDTLKLKGAIEMMNFKTRDHLAGNLSTIGVSLYKHFLQGNDRRIVNI